MILPQSTKTSMKHLLALEIPASVTESLLERWSVPSTPHGCPDQNLLFGLLFSSPFLSQAAIFPQALHQDRY